MLSRTASSVALVLLLLASSASAGTSGNRTSAIGADGTILRVLNGTAADLLPEDSSLEPDATILVLDLQSSADDGDRYLVPGTGSIDPENSESLVLDPSRGVTHILWQTHVNGIHPRLQLISFDGSEWSEILTIGSGPFDEKGTPQLVISAEKNGRTVLNIAWWQKIGLSTRKLFSPVILEQGVDPTAIPIFDLSSFFEAPDATEYFPAELDDYVSLISGDDDRTVIAGWMDSDSGRLHTASVELLPRALSIFAEKARAQIIALGITAESSADFGLLVSDAIIEAGTGFHDSAVLYLAAVMRELVDDAGSDLSEGEIGSIADKARAQIIALGSRIDVGGLTEGGLREILEIPAGEDLAPHLLVVAPLLGIGLPELGENPQIFLSARGDRILVAWDDEDSIVFTETSGAEWTEAVSIPVTEELSHATILSMLQTRL